MLQGYSFFSNPFLKFCFLTPAFSSIIWFHMFVHAFTHFKIPVHCSGTRQTMNNVNCLSLLQALFLLLCQFYMNQNIQNSWPHWSWAYSLAISFLQSLPESSVGKIRHISRRPWIFQARSSSDYFPLLHPRHPWSFSFAVLFCWAFSSIFLGLNQPHWLLQTVCFWMLTVSTLSSVRYLHFMELNFFF